MVKMGIASNPLFQIKSTGVQLVIGALFGNQFFMAAAFNDASVVKYHNYIGVLDGGKSVGDDEGGSVFQKLI